MRPPSCPEPGEPVLTEEGGEGKDDSPDDVDDVVLAEVDDAQPDAGGVDERRPGPTTPETEGEERTQQRVGRMQRWHGRVLARRPPAGDRRRDRQPGSIGEDRKAGFGDF